MGRLLVMMLRPPTAFESIVTVLHHPRSMNCHSSGDFPRQGDDSHQHKMNVRRGAEGQGVAGMRCGTCHQDHNVWGSICLRERPIGIFRRPACR
jgi:hypothetical protein